MFCFPHSVLQFLSLPLLCITSSGSSYLPSVSASLKKTPPPHQLLLAPVRAEPPELRSCSSPELRNPFRRDVKPQRAPPPAPQGPKAAELQGLRKRGDSYTPTTRSCNTGAGGSLNPTLWPPTTYLKPTFPAMETPLDLPLVETFVFAIVSAIQFITC